MFLHKWRLMAHSHIVIPKNHVWFKLNTKRYIYPHTLFSFKLIMDVNMNSLCSWFKKGAIQYIDAAKF